MKYKIELPIHKPRLEVWKFFRDPAKTRLWQRSLKQIDLVNGLADQPGAESIWLYKEHDQEFSLTEKVLQAEEPFRFESVFENEFASNTVNNSFLEQSDGTTLWISETEYKFKTLLMKIMGPVYKKNYVARSQKQMERFKEAIEKG